VLSSRPPSSHFHFAPHHHHHHHRPPPPPPIPSSLSQTPVSLQPEPQQTQLSRSILSTKLGKKTPPQKQNQKKKKTPNTIHRHTTSERLSMEKCNRWKRGSLAATTSACKMRRRVRSRLVGGFANVNKFVDPLQHFHERVIMSAYAAAKEGRKEGRIPVASILQWVWAN